MRYNGCGSDAFNNDVLNTLNVGYKTTLEAACNKHDICYNCVSIIFESRRVFWTPLNWKMEAFAKTVNGWNRVAIFANSSISGIWQGFEFFSGSFHFKICFSILKLTFIEFIIETNLNFLRNSLKNAHVAWGAFRLKSKNSLALFKISRIGFALE